MSKSGRGPLSGMRTLKAQGGGSRSHQKGEFSNHRDRDESGRISPHGFDSYGFSSSDVKIIHKNFFHDKLKGMHHSWFYFLTFS